MISFNYKPELLLIAISYSLLGSFSFFSTIQRIRYIDNLRVAIIFVIISSILVSACSVWCTHFLVIFSMKMDNEHDLYVDLRLTLVSLVIAIFCNGIGFYISFFPYLKRCIQEYKIKNSNANLTRNFTNISAGHNRSLCEINLMENNFITGIEKSKNEYLEYKEFFKSFKLIKREYFQIFLGGLFIGPSIILLHIVGMLAIGFNGYLIFDKFHQIWISILGSLACFVINIGFFYKDALWVKCLLTLTFSATVFAVHCSSVHFTTFQFSENNPSYSNQFYFIDLTTCSRILFVTLAILNFLFREVTNYYLNSSFFILQTIRNYMSKNDKNFNDVVIFIDNLIHLKDVTVKIKKKLDEKIIRVE